MKERITYYDSLRGLAIIGVVFIHTMKYQDPVFLNAEIIFRQIINFSVPLFLALSGFFLAQKQIQNKEQYFHFLKKQIPRVYLPYFLWSLLYIYRYCKNERVFNDLGKVSYAVYLLHILVLMFITKIVLYFKLLYNSFYIELFIGSLTILSSYLICITLRMINKNLASKYLGI